MFLLHLLMERRKGVREATTYHNRQRTWERAENNCILEIMAEIIRPLEDDR